jgi:hypothetical protein
MTKGNEGSAAQQLLANRLSILLECFLRIVLLLNFIGIGGNAQQRTTKEES